MAMLCISGMWEYAQRALIMYLFHFLTSLYCDTPVKVAILVVIAESAMEEASSGFPTLRPVTMETKSIPAMKGM